VYICLSWAFVLPTCNSFLVIRLVEVGQQLNQLFANSECAAVLLNCAKHRIVSTCLRFFVNRAALDVSTTLALINARNHSALLLFFAQIVGDYHKVRCTCTAFV
jgi:hypothetical protein